ncbi:MAG: sigma-70 family RNA polymerase sigma factor [Calditrichaeota bacterium]|nr:MAG: sigma-70 family RNA polymerase sigma factor [Calditrichota bacterium]
MAADGKKTGGQTKQTDERRLEDRRLIQAARAGDQKAFEGLLTKYRSLVYHVMFKMVRNPQEAEDLTQEAFIKAFHALASFNEEFAFSTWLMKIATNNCIDFLRKKKLRTFSIDEPIQYKDEQLHMELPDHDPTPERQLLNEERSRLIDEAIASLPPRYRHVIVLRHKEEKSYEEIAEILKLPLGTVKARIFRAREMLNKKIKGFL